MDQEHIERGTLFQRQILPTSLTLIVAAVLVGVIYLQILLLNRFTQNDIILQIHWTDVLIGLTVYVKTAVDFAIFMGNMMHSNRGWKSRISIEIGTALGNALGTMLILFLWVLFKEIDWLLALMIFIAALVLFKLAEDGLAHARESDRNYNPVFKVIVRATDIFLKHVNWFTAPLLRFILPNINLSSSARPTQWSLFLFAVTVPFILGLDNFAGYVPLFSVVNILGFSVGAFIGHAVLNIALYISPESTIKVVKNPIIAFIGSLVFIGLAAWGLYETVHILSTFSF